MRYAKIAVILLALGFFLLPIGNLTKLGLALGVLVPLTPILVYVYRSSRGTFVEPPPRYYDTSHKLMDSLFPATPWLCGQCNKSNPPKSGGICKYCGARRGS